MEQVDNLSEKKKEFSYVFPSPMAKMLGSLDERTQFEASMLSMTFILLGMIGFSIYLVIESTSGWWFKGFLIFNSFWGVIFLLSYLATTYQQYKTYMETKEALDLLASPDTIKELEPIKLLNKKGG